MSENSCNTSPKKHCGFRPHSKFQRICAYIGASILGLFLLWIFLGYTLVPYLVKSTLQTELTNVLGRTVVVDTVQFYPLHLTLDIYGVHIQEKVQEKVQDNEQPAPALPASTVAAFSPVAANSAVPAHAPEESALTTQNQPHNAAPHFADTFSLARFSATLSLRSVVKLALVLSELQIDGTTLNVRRYTNTDYNFSDILAHVAQSAAAEKKAQQATTTTKNAAPTATEQAAVLPEEANALFPLMVENFALTNFSAHFYDDTKGSSQHLEKMSFYLPFFSTRLQEKDNITEATVNAQLNSGTIAATLQAAPFADTPSASVTLTIQELPLASYWRYIPTQNNTHLPLNLQSAALSCDVRADVALPSINASQAPNAPQQPQLPQTKVSGTIAFTDIALTDAQSNAPVFSVDAVETDIETLRAPENMLKLSRIAVQAPKLHLVRHASGNTNVHDYAKGFLLALGAQPAENSKAALSSKAKAGEKADAETGTNEGTGNVPDNATATATNDTEAAAPKHAETSAPTFHLAEFAVNNAELFVHDAAAHAADSKNAVRLHLAPLNVRVNNMSNNPAQAVEFETKFGLGDDMGALTASGKVTQKPFAFDASLALQHVELAQFSPYFGLAHGKVQRGNVDVVFDVHTEKPALEGVAATAALTLRNLQLTDTRNSNTVLSVKELQLSNAQFDAVHKRLGVGNVALTAPEVMLFVHKDGTINWQHILGIAPQKDAPTAKQSDAATKTASASSASAAPTPAPPSTTPPATAQSSAPPAASAQHPEHITPWLSNVFFGGATLKDGNITVYDATLGEETKKIALEQIDAKISALETSTKQQDAAKRAVTLSLRSRLFHTPVTLSGKAYPLAPQQPAVTMALDIRGLDMTEFSPYALKFTGQPLTQGQLSVETKLGTEKRGISMQNALNIARIHFGARDPKSTAPSYPLSLGIALLEDDDENIALSLPVTGSLDDPTFGIGNVIGKTISKLFLDIATSPFSLLGSIFSFEARGEDVGMVHFAAGSTELSPSIQKRLMQLAQVLHKRPKLLLEVHAYLPDNADVTALKKQAFLRLLQTQKYADLSKKAQKTQTVADMHIAPQEYAEWLNEAYDAAEDADSIPEATQDAVDDAPENARIAAMEQALKATIQISHTELRAFSGARAQALRNFLLEQHEELAERVFILAEKKVAEPSKESQKTSHVQLVLQ